MDPVQTLHDAAVVPVVLFSGEKGRCAMALRRRDFLTGVTVGAVALPAIVACHPRAARERGDPFAVLDDEQGRTLEVLGDTLLPGAAVAGIAHFVDQQLASPTPMLMLKYLDFPMAYPDFYASGIGALDAVSRNRHAKDFAFLAAPEREAIVREISRGAPAGWDGPPAPLFYCVTRSDAVDVVYGTEEGFAKLAVPYRAHIQPPAKW